MIYSFKLKNYKEEIKKVPNTAGVYFIVIPDEMKIKTITFTSNIKNHSIKEKNKPYKISKLVGKTEKVKDNEKVVYIGKAKNLKKRLKQYMNYLYKGSKNHAGGRAIGQIQNYDSFLICRYMLSEIPEEIEKEKLIEYRNRNGELPLANWKVG